MDAYYSFKTGQKQPLSVLDYVLLSTLFCLSIAIGLYHAYVGRSSATEHEFHFAGRNLHPIPVSMSIAATFFSALTILGGPAEVYTFGIMTFWMVGGCLISTVLVAHVFLPKFHELQYTSCFEYIERRYSKGLRLIASTMYLLQANAFCALALYVPCLAVEVVAGVSMYTTMVIAAFVCTAYTVLGGMRSVVWVDCLQLVVIFAGMAALLIQGSIATGGFTNAWQLAENKGRTMFNDFSVDPRTRHSVWSLTIGYSVILTYQYGINQTQVQRACSMSSAKKTTIAAWLHFPQFALILVFTCMTGIVMFAFYSECDPVEFGIVKRNDQLVPLFVLDVLSKNIGLPGIFMACVFSGSLSSLSSSLNAISAVVLKDFIGTQWCNKFPQRHGLAMSRLLVVIFGCLMVLGAVLVSKLTSLVLQISYTFTSVVSGPVMGVFASGLFFPWTNNKGASVGLFISFSCMMWLCIGTIIEQPPGSPALPTYTTGCNWNITDINVVSVSPRTSAPSPATVIPSTEPLVYNFYRMSYLWYASVGFLVNITVTLIVSFMTGYTKPSSVDPKLICPIFDVLCPWLPERIRRPLRFGVQYKKHHDNIYTDRPNMKSQTTRLVDPL